MSTNDVKVVSDGTLRELGFVEAQIQAGAGRADGYVGELEGVKYFRAQQDITIMGEFHRDGSGRRGAIIDQQGEGNNLGRRK